ncbi:MAG: DUF4417 domain-containing protein [Oscillospiraceae bacterium]|nr:DUF4417 domain-containing protein [Oscillospiraceae bacterium]
MIKNDTMGSSSFPMQTIENEDEKNKKKLKIVRNEFKRVGKYGMPLIKKQHIDFDKIQPWCFVKTKPNDEENKHKTIHFFTYDWNFEAAYSKPEVTFEKLEQYYALLTPEFSTYKDMPLVLQAYSVFKNRWCGAFWQSQGKIVIPTVTWGTPNSHEFCFDGIEQGSVVAVSTYSREHNQKAFVIGYNKMLEAVKPSAIVCYGEIFDGMKGNIKAFSPFNHQELIAKLGMAEFTRRYIEGDLYPSN